MNPAYSDPLDKSALMHRQSAAAPAMYVSKVVERESRSPAVGFLPGAPWDAPYDDGAVRHRCTSCSSQEMQTAVPKFPFASDGCAPV